MAEVRFWLPEGVTVGGRYTIEATLGVGGYGITYRAFDNRLDRIVAVKEFFPAFMANRFVERSYNVRCQEGSEASFRRGIDRFEAEAKTLAQLYSIQGIVKVSDYFEENCTAYLVMDYLDGKNLKQMTDGFGGRIPPEILIPILSQAITALGKVHEKGLIHRDISPDNIMMLSDGSVCLIDFGNARDTSEDKTMTLAMKEGFAPPEQYRAHGQGTYTDVYSLCATIYYCLTGKLPTQPMDRLLGVPLPKPSELGVNISPQIESAIMDGLELYVNKRIATMEELAARLYSAPVSDVSPERIEEMSAIREKAKDDTWYNNDPSITTAPISEHISGTLDLTRPIPSITEPTPTSPVTVSTVNDNKAENGKIDSLDGLFNEGIFRIRKICAGIFQKMKEL